MDNKEKNPAVQPSEETVSTCEAKVTETKEEPKKENKKTKKSGGVKNLLKSRKIRHGSIAAAVTAVVVALVIVLNIVVGLLVDRFPNLKIDFTSNQAYALSEDTTQYIKSLKKDVTV